MSWFQSFSTFFKRKGHNNTKDFQNADVKTNGDDDNLLTEKVEEMNIKQYDNEKPHLEKAKPFSDIEKDDFLPDNEKLVTLTLNSKLNPSQPLANPKSVDDPDDPAAPGPVAASEPVQVIQPIAKPGQDFNEANGYSYKVKKMESVKRFIVLGTEGNSYYATEKERFDSNIKCVESILEESERDPSLIDVLLDTLEEYSCKGRVAKDDAILSILAVCVLYENIEVQKKAYTKVKKICNIPTKLFMFIELCQKNINKKRKVAQNPMQLRKRTRRPDEKNLPTESSDKDADPPSKYKKFNTSPMRSSAWGRMRRAGIGAFYTDSKKSANYLLQVVTKYKQRNNWNHKQVLGYCHPKISNEDEERPAKELVLAYSTRGYDGFKKKLDFLKERDGYVDQVTSQVEVHIELLERVAKLLPSKEEDVEELIKAIKEYGIRDSPEEFTTVDAIGGNDQPLVKNTEKKKQPFQLVREHIPNGFLKMGKVWEALLQDMPMTAMLRNLGRMSSFGLFDNNKDNVEIVVNAFTDPKRLTKARIHPLKILIALKAYELGKSGPVEERRFFFLTPKKENKRPKPDNPYNWRPNREILTALDKGFYLSFKQPELRDAFKTGKKFMLALDVSGSMTFQGCFGCEQITPAVAATALSMVTWNIEDNVEMVAFGGHLEKLEKYGLRKDMKLNDAMSTMRKVNFGSTDCSLPMQYARKNNIDVDVFIVYTDSDTGYGNIDPVDALKEYRRERNPNAKLIVMAMTSNGFTIADPEDRGMLDIVGFDTGVPEMIAEFVKQDIVE